MSDLSGYFISRNCLDWSGEGLSGLREPGLLHDGRLTQRAMKSTRVCFETATTEMVADTELNADERGMCCGLLHSGSGSFGALDIGSLPRALQIQVWRGKSTIRGQQGWRTRGSCTCDYGSENMYFFLLHDAAAAWRPGRVQVFHGCGATDVAQHAQVP